jgi:hypothetical protein
MENKQPETVVEALRVPFIDKFGVKWFPISFLSKEDVVSALTQRAMSQKKAQKIADSLDDYAMRDIANAIWDGIMGIDPDACYWEIIREQVEQME